jgi:hypothetical protein
MRHFVVYRHVSLTNQGVAAGEKKRSRNTGLLSQSLPLETCRHKFCPVNRAYLTITPWSRVIEVLLLEVISLYYMLCYLKSHQNIINLFLGVFSSNILS